MPSRGMVPAWRSLPTAYGRLAGALRFSLIPLSRLPGFGDAFSRPWTGESFGIRLAQRKERSLEVFVFEFVTGGGFLDVPQPPPSLLAEGRAMLRAVLEDFCRLPRVNVTVTSDHRFPLEVPDCRVSEVSTIPLCQRAFAGLAGRADWTVVIAPEFDGLLQQYAHSALAAGGRLLGPSPECIEIASDKQQTADRLRSAGVPVPEGVRLQPGAELPDRFPYPAVLKRLDGAGSLDICGIADAAAAAVHGPVSMASRLERFVTGTPASVAVLCGPQGRQALVPCRQQISDDGRFLYQGGITPLQGDFADRAQQLAVDAIACLPGPMGYLGVDLVLGDEAAGDVVIEINPRLTTSYVGLRAVYPHNLAQAMWTVAEGGRVELLPSGKCVAFDASGRVGSAAAGESEG